MKKAFFFLIYIGMFFSIHAQIRDMTQAELDSLVSQRSDTLYVINFWATWCAPCVKELPYFEAAHDSFSGHNVKVLLVSLDFASAREKQLPDFVARKGLKSEVVFMKGIKEDAFVNFVDSSWSGAIPATWFVEGWSGQRTFHEGDFEWEALKRQIEQLLLNRKED